MLDEAARVLAEAGSTLRALTWLRRRHPADLVAAAVETPVGPVRRDAMVELDAQFRLRERPVKEDGIGADA